MNWNIFCQISGFRMPGGSARHNDDSPPLSPATRKLIENLAEGSVISDGVGGAPEGGGSLRASVSLGGQEAAAGGSSSGGAAAQHRPGGAQPPGAGASGPMHVLYPSGQMVPVGHALQFLGAQQQLQMQSIPAAQQMFMLYLQGQHASYMQQQAAMGTSTQAVATKQQNAAAGECGPQSGGTHEGAQPSLEHQQKLQDKTKALQAQLQQHQVLITTPSVYLCCMPLSALENMAFMIFVVCLLFFGFYVLACFGAAGTTTCGTAAANITAIRSALRSSGIGCRIISGSCCTQPSAR